MEPLGDKVLVYHHRAGDNPIVANGLAVISVYKLNDLVAERGDLQVTRKTIPRGALNMDILEVDLQTSAQRDMFGTMPNQETNVAGIKVPIRIWLGSVAGSAGFKEMIIISKKRSANM
nr:hypothetical protein B0A51_02118 [Rachicladosporium sp. CCFEE 5018]